MEFITSGIFIALWLGILTSISPCPLATNIAAISFVSKRVGSVSKILLTGMLYTFGRMLAYTLLSMVIIFSLISVPEIARFLQKYINIILGPLLIIVGLIMTNIIKFNLSIGSKLSDKIGSKAEKSGIWGGIFLGFIFALSFCPVSAGIFFGSLLPLSLKYNSAVILPFVYGIGTALPVLVFAVVISFSANYVGKVYNQLQKFEWWAQRITGVLFIAIGLYFIYRYWF